MTSTGELQHAGICVSVLDTSPIVQGSNSRQALTNTADLAVLADRLGYHRYWVPEHHSMRGVASAAPAVLTAHLAGITRHIRVGAGGVLLPNHPPLIVAEQFGTLAALHPGRIDLGLGRAVGGPKHAAEAIRSPRERDAQTFEQQVSELMGHLDPPPDQAVVAVPAIGNTPSIWILGTSPASGRLAGSLGLPYAFAHHLNPDDAAQATRAYYEAFQPPTGGPQVPSTLVSVSAIAADTDDRAEWLAGPTRLKTLSRKQGRRILLPSPQEAAAHPEITSHSANVLTGSPETLRKHLQAVLDQTGARELMVTTPVYDHDDRRHSYKLIREIADDLRPAPADSRTSTTC